MRTQLLARSIALLGSLALLPAWQFAEPRHLYVDAFDSSGKHHVILRYALRDGLPATAPDRVIVDFGRLAGGEVYAEAGEQTFFVSRPGAVKPYRRFHIHLGGIKYVSSSAVAPDGVFWVEYTYFTARPLHKPLVGALAFSPHARGDVYPMKVLSQGGSASLAFNSRGDMFIDGFVTPNYAILELKDVLQQPQILRAYQNSYVDNPYAQLAVNGDDDLFVQTENNAIAVFAPGADPMGPPTNVVQTTIRSMLAIAAGPRYLYVINGQTNQLNVFLGHKNGPQQPVATVTIPYQSPRVLVAGP